MTRSILLTSNCRQIDQTRLESPLKKLLKAGTTGNWKLEQTLMTMMGDGLII